ncbi:VOC family protein [Streptomyces sp. OF3]|uniref:VOC family protein n=1 Tax=Streptomyces alkaliterrae TaxID=2213162 RepID=A0A7W3WNP2_9ACTN|nr:VOC family protein [Streptomyces alkaliterrae]MBB1255255.1 VOC family protein [Streptomyces alkaliterrae]
MITTDFVKGSPCWLDLGVPDTGAAAGFYRAVFGWELEAMGEDDEHQYGVFRSGGKVVGGLGRLTEEGARPAWIIYYRTDDVQATVAEAERMGGTVRMAPMDAEGEGWLAQLSDPLGGQFAVWQPGSNEGIEVTDQPNSLCWTELYTTDADGAKEFYGTLFGWQTQDMPLPAGGGVYSLITPEGLSEERMQGGLMEMPADALPLTGGRPYWHPVFATDDCDGAVARVTEHGGSVQMGPEDAEGVGRLAVCSDPFGADFVLLQPPPQG